MGRPREIFDTEHEDFRKIVAEFVAREIAPHAEQWDADGIVSREVWRAAGQQGLLGWFVAEEYGGGGVGDDFRYNAVLTEELTRLGGSGVALSLHNDVIGPYLVRLADDEQKRRWLPGFCSGELITAIAMTEPGAGSDLNGIATRAEDRGDHWLLNGQKTFISNGILSDLIIVVARTDPDAGHKGISLLVVERGMSGFERGRNLAKMGQHAQDTAELFFTDVVVPKANLLGTPNRGFAHLMENLPSERLAIAVAAASAAEKAFALALEHARTRQAFGRPIGAFQHNRFVLAELATEVDVMRTYVDHCIARMVEGTLDAVGAAKAKWWTTELTQKIINAAVQLHGGYGYMSEYEISRMYTDTRVHTIYGGTTEIMKEIIGRSLGI